MKRTKSLKIVQESINKQNVQFASPDSPCLDRKMLELLVCPLTGDTLRYDAAAQELISIRARLAYKIRDGVPIMIASEARILDESEV